MTERVEWSRGPADSRVVRWTVSFWVGFLAVFALVALLAVGAFAWNAYVEREYAMLAAIAVLTTVGSWASVLYLVPILCDPEVRRSFHETDLVWDLRAIDVVLGVVAVLVVLAASLRLGLSAFAVGFAAMVAAMVVGTMLRTTGAVDPDAATLTYAGSETDLTGLTGFRTFEVGDTALIRLSYADGYADLDTPKTLVVPAADATAVREALDAVADEAVEPRAGDPTARRIVAAAGIGCLLVAVGSVLLAHLGDAPSAVQLLGWSSGSTARCWSSPRDTCERPVRRQGEDRRSGRHSPRKVGSPSPKNASYP